MLTFGREPVYVRAAELPPQPPDMEAFELLKPERVQHPTGASVTPPTRKRG